MTKKEKGLRIVFLTTSIIYVVRLAYDLGYSLGDILTTETDD